MSKTEFEKLEKELECFGELWDRLEKRFERVCSKFVDVVKSERQDIIKEFEDRLVAMYCISPEVCKIEGDFVCSECKKLDKLIIRIKEKEGQ